MVRNNFIPTRRLGSLRLGVDPLPSQRDNNGVVRVAETLRIVRAAAGRGHRRVQATALLPDNDLIVGLLGGERSHVGAVAIGIPRLSLRDPSQHSASSSVITVTGHKEDALAKTWAEELARRLGRVVVVVAGMHLEAPEPGDIEALEANSALAVERLFRRLDELPAK